MKLSKVFYLLGFVVEFVMVCQDFSLIKKWEDVNPFAGKAVLFTVEPECSYIARPDNMFKINECYAGRVGREKSKWGVASYEECPYGYRLSRLIKYGSVASNCALINCMLSRVVLKMRVATDLERCAIIEAIRSKSAGLDYYLILLCGDFSQLESNL